MPLSASSSDELTRLTKCDPLIAQILQFVDNTGHNVIATATLHMYVAIKLCSYTVILQL